MSLDLEGLTWNVTMLGPSRVGKTSLLTALQVAANDYFSGTPVRVDPEDEITRRAFSDNNNAMVGELAARRFSPQLGGTKGPQNYGLTVSAGIDSQSLTLRFRDYPGGYLTTEKSAEVAELLADSPTVIIPIDATLIMEAGEEHGPEIVKGLMLAEVEEQVRNWVKTRVQRGDPVRLFLVPVKCETYFSDNYGRRDESDKLYRRVQQHYGRIVKVYREESVDAPVLYAPVDTIGPINLMDVTWVADERSIPRMTPEYRVRSDSDGIPFPRTIKGAEPVLAHLISDVLNTQDRALRILEEEAQGELSHLQEQNKKLRSNWFRRILDDLSGKHLKRAGSLEETRNRLDSMDASLCKLARSVDSLTGDYGRVRPWS
jgi:GTPase SAR1 family protein